MASRYVISAVILAAVTGGAGYFVGQKQAETAVMAAESASLVASVAPAAGTPAEPVLGRVPTESNPKVAEVGSEIVLKSDVDQLYNAIKQRAGNQAPAQDQVFWMLVDQIVASRLIIQAAQTEKLQDKPEIKDSIRMASEQIVQEAYVQGLFKDIDSEATLKPLYDKMVANFKGQEEVKASHILVKDEAKAKELIEQLKKGAKFEDLAKANSEDPGSKENGGDLGFFAKDAMVPEFATVAFALAKGQVSQEPVKTQFGYHIIKAVDRRERKAPSYDEAKAMLVQEAQQEKINATIEQLRKTTKVERFAGAGIPALPADATAAPATATP